MTPIPIVCANCGAQYRLPETFSAPQARCKKCGGTIDVAAQRAQPDAAATPSASAAPKSSAATSTSSSTGRRSERSGRSARSPRGGKAADHAEESSPRSRVGASRGRTGSGSGRRGGTTDEDRAGGGSRSRRGGRSETDQPKSNVVLWTVAGLVGLGVVVALYFFVFAGGDQPAKTPVADAVTAPPDQPETVGDAAVKPDDQTSLSLGEAATAGGEEIGAELAGDATPAEAAANRQAVEATPATKGASTPKPDKPMSADEVFDPKAELQPIERPEWIDEDEWQQANDAVDAMQEGGLAGIRGKNQLEEMGYKAIPSIVNKLRVLDYTNGEDTAFAYELNRLLGAMSIGVNASFRPQPIGEPISPEDADWNAMTVKAWFRFYENNGSPEQFKKMVQVRKTRNMQK